MTTIFQINDETFKVDLSKLPPDITLNTFIREHAQLTATKFMCLEGGCGACVCAVRRKHPKSGEIETFAVNSCLTPLATCMEWDIVTNEGIGNKAKGYNPIQKVLASMNGTQCGFCSPGFVMNMYALQAGKGEDALTMEEIENSFGGNICRCTGYRPILDAFKSFAGDSTIKMPPECQDIEDLSTKICSKSGLKCAGNCQKGLTELVFSDGSKWYWPKNLTELFAALDKLPNDEQYMLVAGNTAHGVYRRSAEIKHFFDMNSIAELKEYALDGQTLTLGANLSLTEAMDIFKQVAKTPGFEYCEQLWNHFDLIANVPVRNTGTIAGNIAIKKAYPEFPSDVFITFEALDAEVLVNSSVKAQKKISLMDYLQSSESKLVVTAFVLKAYPKENYIFKSYKIMPRAQNAHAYVNSAFLLETPDYKIVKSARICFGGIRPDFVHATAVENNLSGKPYHDKETLKAIFTELPKTFAPDNKLPDALPEYRKLLACGLLYKFLLSIAPDDMVTPEFKSGGEILKRPLSSGSQVFGVTNKSFPVTQPVIKIEGLIQCSGEATYMNDVLTTKNTGYCAFVIATKVGATIEEIDPTEALKVPGVLAFYSAKDIPGTNSFYDKSFDAEEEEIFCSERVKYYGQPCGVIVAETSDAAHLAASKVKIMYSKPVAQIFTSISDVLDAGVVERVHSIVKNPVESLILKDDNNISASGIFILGSQYHFTMEPQTTVVVPFESGLKIYSATQWMDHTQLVIAKMLNLKVHDVQLEVPRLGGAYGSKITRGNQCACAAALAAYKLYRPIRFVQKIESMMDSNGKRWACRSDYDFRVKKNGKILSLKNMFYEDGGCTLNDNPVGGHSTTCSRNCYEFDNNYHLEGQAVLTDAPSSTWCRAPGSVEGIAMIENIMEHIAFETNVDPVDVRLINMSADNKMRGVVDQFVKSTDYRRRKEEIKNFNEKNRWNKRGLGIAVMQYPIFYFGQYPVTVAVYHADGTVVITHGGIEMGQGMNTKIAQVAAYVLNVPLESIKIVASNTVNGANSMVTGGAIGSEVLCSATRKACMTINERLKAVRAKLKPDATWKEVVQAAYGLSVNLIANDNFKVGDLENYIIYGVSLTEVEVDVLTGNLLVKRVDIFEDTGESLSPLIDVGQVEGAFVMALGYWLTEQLIYDRQNGQLMTNRTWNYKVPGAKDIPIDFRIELSQKYPNSGGFMRSKATGEPATCLAVSVIFAIQQALQSARKDAGITAEWIRLGAPTTPETIVLNASTDVQSFDY